MNTCKRLLLASICLLLMAASKSSHFKIKGIQGPLLTNVKSRLNELYQNQPEATEIPASLEQQIIKAMQPYGYFHPVITINHNLHPIAIHISPGPQIIITNIQIGIIGPGKDNPAILNTLHHLPLHIGEPLNSQQYEDAKDALYTTAEAQGYLKTNFEKSALLIDEENNKAAILIKLNTGEQYYFGQVQFNPTFIAPELLHRFIPFTPQDSYSTDQILAFNNNLTQSGYFKSVIVKPDPEKSRRVPVDVHLEPADSVSYSLGAGYGTDTGPRGQTAIHVVPVNPSGDKFNAIVQGSLKENAVLAQYLMPGKNPVTDKYSLTSSFSNLNYTAGYANSWLFSVAEQHALNWYQRIFSLNGLAERYNYSYQPKMSRSMLFPKAAFTFRKVSDPLFSPSGFNITVNVLGALQGVLSQVGFGQTTMDAKLAYTIEPIKTRVFVHAIQGFTAINNVDNLPLSLAMLLGSTDNLKAYNYQSVGPGKIMSYAGVELQKEVIEKWYLVGFFDSGDVYRPTPRQFKYDVGTGILWVSPVGPIKIGVTQAVNNHLQRLPTFTPKLVINMGPDL